MFDFQLPDSQSALWQIRLLWAASIIGQLVITAILLTMFADFDAPQSLSSWFVVTMALLLVLTPAGWFFRNQIYKRNWQGHAVTPRGYFIGNIFLQALLESITLFAVITGVFCGALLASLIAAALAMALQLVNFPTGQMLHPREPDMTSDGLP